jgi:catechol 2,3-dioxygenase-like lactoylglutathione lyase family enzyme
VKQSIAHVALVVRAYDEAIEFYTQKQRFWLLEESGPRPGADLPAAARARPDLG